MSKSDARQYHWVIQFDSTTNQWSVDTEMEESIFWDGTVYNLDTRSWELGYVGDGEFTGREDQLSSILNTFISVLNLGSNK